MNNLAAKNISKIVQIVRVASEREDELETESMGPCTMTHSNFFHVSTVSKLICCAVTFTNLTSLPFSPCFALYVFSQEHRITSADMEKIDYLKFSRHCGSISKARLPPDNLVRTLVKACSNRVGHMVST